MKDTDYTFAVARIRVNEGRLLRQSELGSLIAAPGYDECARRLRERGYAVEGPDPLPALRARLEEMWALLTEILPDPAQFSSVLIRNDFHNLKVCLKALTADKSPEGLFEYPSVYDPAEIRAHVNARENDKLPPLLRHADRSAYRILTKTGFAQLADTVIDRAALESALVLAKTADHPVMYELACLQAAVADIRTLYRCVLTGKEKSFMERAVCECPAFPKEEIIRAACEGVEALLGFLRATPFGWAEEALRESPAAFETAADDTVINLLSAGKSETFGIGPLVGYYYAVRTEVLNLRILLSAKRAGLPDDIIRERMRRLYV